MDQRLLFQHPTQTPGRASTLKGTICSTIAIGPILLADEPISPKKSKSVPEPTTRVMEVEATSPRSSEWTSVRIGPEEEDTAGQDVLAVCVLVASEDSRYAQIAEGWRQQQGGPGWEGCIWDLLFSPLGTPGKRDSLGLLAGTVTVACLCRSYKTQRSDTCRILLGA